VDGKKALISNLPALAPEGGGLTDPERMVLKVNLRVGRGRFHDKKLAEELIA